MQLRDTTEIKFACAWNNAAPGTPPPLCGKQWEGPFLDYRLGGLDGVAVGVPHDVGELGSSPGDLGSLVDQFAHEQNNWGDQPTVARAPLAMMKQPCPSALASFQPPSPIQSVVCGWGAPWIPYTVDTCGNMCLIFLRGCCFIATIIPGGSNVLEYFLCNNYSRILQRLATKYSRVCLTSVNLS